MEARTRRLTTETKQAFKTTEFWVYVVLLVAVLIAGTVDDAEGTEFGADKVWLYATILTVGYLISRGLAKSGSRDPYSEQADSGESGSLQSGDSEASAVHAGGTRN